MFDIGLQRVIFAFVVLISSYETGKCYAITNTNFKSSDRPHAIDNSTINRVKTLQKDEIGKRTFFIPADKFKEIPDSAHSSSSDSHNRGLLFNEHQGYGLHDYEAGPHYGYGHDYQYNNPNIYDHHDYDSHHYPGYHNYDHGHYKYDKHALATKAALWPLAGIALLGAAALAVTNPVLVQLGVVSGKRRRRDTEEVIGSDFATDSLKKYTEKIQKPEHKITSKTENEKYDNMKRRSLKTDNLNKDYHFNENFNNRFLLNKNNGKDIKSKIKGPRASVMSNIDQSTKLLRQYDRSYDDNRFIPIPIKIRSKGSESETFD